MSDCMPRSFEVNKSMIFWWKVKFYRNGRLAGSGVMKRRDHAYELGKYWIHYGLDESGPARIAEAFGRRKDEFDEATQKSGWWEVRPGPERVQDAIRRDRGGEAPPMTQGWA